MKKKTLDLGKYLAVTTAPHVGRWRYERKLPLRTDGHLRAIALGVGNAFSTRMFQSNFILVKGDTAVFVDLGTSAALRLSEFQLSVHDIRHLIITHSHADHIGSVEELALKRRYEAPFIELPKRDRESPQAYMERIVAARRSGSFRPTLYLPQFYAEELWGMSLRGGLMFSEEVDLKESVGGMVLDNFFRIVNPVPCSAGRVRCWEVDVGPIHVKTFVTRHVPDAAIDEDTPNMYSVGLVIDGRLYISGDTQFDPETVDALGSGCESLWHDCQHFPGGVHAYYDEMKTLPAAVRSRMHLYHLSDGMLDIDVKADGFAGHLEPAPTVYDFE